MPLLPTYCMSFKLSKFAKTNPVFKLHSQNFSVVGQNQMFYLCSQPHNVYKKLLNIHYTVHQEKARAHCSEHVAFMSKQYDKCTLRLFVFSIFHMVCGYMELHRTPPLPLTLHLFIAAPILTGLIWTYNG